MDIMYKNDPAAADVLFLKSCRWYNLSELIIINHEVQNA